MLGISSKSHTTSRRSIPAYELDLITAAQRGDISAFNQLIRTYQELAYGVAYHLLDDVGAAETATQRACETAYRRIRTWNGDEFKLWLLGIVTQECKRAERLPRGTFSGAQSPIQMGLQVLPIEERVVCVLGDVIGLGEEEIARLTQVPVETLRTVRGRARRQMRDVLQLNGVLAGNVTAAVGSN